MMVIFNIVNTNRKPNNSPKKLGTQTSKIKTTLNNRSNLKASKNGGNTNKSELIQL